MISGENDTIAAISTPPGSGGIGIIRLSGSESVNIADGIFTCRKNNIENDAIRAAGEVARMLSYTLKHGYIFDPDSRELIDECLLSVMRCPKSYTGEDVVEINCHGGYAVMKRILSLLYRKGARPAEPGEFTKRAFLNGRIDLSRAEAVSDIINAKTEESRKAAFMQLSGSLSGKILHLEEILADTLASLEVSIDYPEYDEDEKICEGAISSLNPVLNELKDLSASFERGRLLREGLRIAICGRPNAGKSSLLNSMLGTDRAIVTDIPGTTRDTIEEMAELDGLPVILTDTAGLRNTDDPVEKIGVDRAYSALRQADMLLFLADGTAEPEEEYSLFEELSGKTTCGKYIVAVNKSDIADGEKKKDFTGIFEEKCGTEPYFICAKKDGGDVIFGILKERLERDGLTAGEQLITNERHKNLVDKAIESIKKAINNAENRMPVDIISYDVWESAGFLGEITGKNVSEDVVNTIFSKFCLGK